VPTEAGSHPPAGPGPEHARRRRVAWTLALVAGALAIYAPILAYMVQHWQLDPDYSHGFVVVPLALYFAWERRDAVRRAALRPSWWGLAPMLLGTLTLTVGRLGVELMNMRVSFVLTLIGIVLLVLGREVFRALAFPLLFLFLMIPLPRSLVNVVAFPLQLVATDIAVSALYLLEIPALREGNVIHLANAQLFVAEACSGLRSLMALLTLGVVFAYFFRQTTAERLVIVASTLPIAIAVNAFRVAVTGVLAHAFGEEVLEGGLHEFWGAITFTLAFLLLLAEARLLSTLWPRGAGGPLGARA